MTQEIWDACGGALIALIGLGIFILGLRTLMKNDDAVGILGICFGFMMFIMGGNIAWEDYAATLPHDPHVQVCK